MTAAATTVVTPVGASFPPAAANMGVVPVWFEYTCATTDFDNIDDEVVLFGPMPDVAYIRNVAGSLVLDVDGSLAASDLDWTFGFGTVAGVLSVTLYTGNDIAAGAAGHYPSVAIAGSGAWIDIGGLYFGIVVDAAATTPVAATLSVGFEYSQNVRLNTGT